MNIIKSGDSTYHIFEAERDSSMLYRYGILKHDTDEAGSDKCTFSDDRLTFEAGKRIVTIEIEQREKGYILKIPLTERERIFGLGDATRENVMIRGIKAEMYIANVASYGPMPVLLSSDGWGFLLGSTFRSTIDCGKDNPDAITIDVADGKADFYLFRGDSLKDILSKITLISGRSAVLPKYAYGLTLVENEETDAYRLLHNIRLLREKNIPCDVMGLEPNWMETYYDFSKDKKWNKKQFPFPSWQSDNTSSDFTFFYPMREMGMKLSLWLCCDYDLLYAEDENLREDGSAADNSGAVIDDIHLAAGIRSDKITDISEPWFEHLKKFIDNGAAAFKLDGANQVLTHPDRLWGGKYLDSEVHNIYPVLLAKQMTEGFRDYTGTRVLLYTAGAYIGTQKYAATWSGDTGGGQGTLVSLMNYAMCGHSNTACDIEVTDPCAIHYGFLTPWSQYFCWANWKYPWFMNPKTEEMIRFYANLRSSLVPYIYTMAHKAYSEGVPVLRPLSLMFEDDERFDCVKNEYMFGDKLLVGAFDMNLKLPEGKWIDYFDSKVYEGDISYTIPEGKGGALLAREGSVFVTMKPQKYILEKEHEYIINVYPGKDDSFTLIEDDGFTYDYQNGIVAGTLIEMTDSSDSGFKLTIRKRTGSYPGRENNGSDICRNSIPEIKGIAPVNDIIIRIVGRNPASVVYKNSKVDFEYDGRELHFVLKKEYHEAEDVIYTVNYND